MKIKVKHVARTHKIPVNAITEDYYCTFVNGRMIIVNLTDLKHA